eukprot:10210682-Alexandrium_andersonii.AAC.1
MAAAKRASKRRRRFSRVSARWGGSRKGKRDVRNNQTSAYSIGRNLKSNPSSEYWAVLHNLLRCSA